MKYHLGIKPLQLETKIPVSDLTFEDKILRGYFETLAFPIKDGARFKVVCKNSMIAYRYKSQQQRPNVVMMNVLINCKLLLEMIHQISLLLIN